MDSLITPRKIFTTKRHGIIEEYLFQPDQMEDIWKENEKSMIHVHTLNSNLHLVCPLQDAKIISCHIINSITHFCESTYWDGDKLLIEPTYVSYSYSDVERILNYIQGYFSTRTDYKLSDAFFRGW